LIIYPFSSEEVKLFSLGIEKNYFGTSIEYYDYSNTFLYFYYPKYLKLYVINGVKSVSNIPCVEGLCNLIVTYEDGFARKIKKFIEEKKDEKYIYFMPPVFFRLLLAFEHKKKVNEHLNILYENFKRKLINGVDYNYL